MSVCHRAVRFGGGHLLLYETTGADVTAWTTKHFAPRGRADPERSNSVRRQDLQPMNEPPGMRCIRLNWALRVNPGVVGALAVCSQGVAWAQATQEKRRTL